MKIMIIDDSKTARMMLKKALPESMLEGADIVMCENGQEGLDAYKEGRPDVVFLDLTMPVMDGYAFLENIKPIDPDAVVIVVSADIQQSAKERVLALGAKVMVRKPVNPATLKALLDDYVQKDA